MRQEAYRVAFEEANWELKDIVGQFDLLDARKGQIEKVVNVLKPFVSFSAPSAGGEQGLGESSADNFQQRFDTGASREGKGYYSPQARAMRQEAYRVAYDEANSELKEFVLKFEQLRFRKEQIERLVDSLRPLMGQASPVAVMEPSASQVVANVNQRVETPVAAPTQPEPAVEETVSVPEESADPFQRRGDSPVPVGSVSKDLRDYSRLFSSSLHRR
ncbi:MAG: hypothetical protein KGN79_08760 [Acidobacteriota bacterium]|nr:hypothetical protein [Acidobacteriota bacterium]